MSAFESRSLLTELLSLRVRRFFLPKRLVLLLLIDGFRIRKVLEESGPVICEVVMDPKQPLVPKTSFKQLPDGRMISPPLEDLYPFLDREEFMSNMIIPVIDSD